jgi:hypothetical protein
MIKLIYLTAIFVCGVLGETVSLVNISIISLFQTEEDPVEAPKIVTLEEADKGVDTSEQHDPMFPAMNVSCKFNIINLIFSHMVCLEVE